MIFAILVSIEYKGIRNKNISFNWILLQAKYLWRKGIYLTHMNYILGTNSSKLL